MSERTIYPFKIEYLSEDGEILHTVEVTGPETLRTPKDDLGHSPITLRFTWANGDVTEETVP